MKPFDLEAAKRGEPVCTRDGRPVVFGAHCADMEPGRAIVGWLNGSAAGWYANGRYYVDDDCWDLFMAPVKHRVEVWQNWYRNTYNEPFAHAVSFASKNHADREELPGRIACTMAVVEWEE